VIQRLKTLLAGDAEKLAAWTAESSPRWLWTCLAVFVLSCAVYGASFGLWRSEGQALATAVKFPLVVLLTCVGNTLLNGSLALVLGTGMSFRQSGIAILMSFTIMGLILATFAPVMVFLCWNVPAITSPQAATGQHVTLLAHVTLIAFAGVVGNHRLWQLLRHFTGAVRRANIVLLAWLAGNLLLGSQISWILRPWIGRPGSPVRFFSPEPLRGNFFEAIWQAARSLLNL
jgi:hypothetical protein